MASRLWYKLKIKIPPNVRSYPEISKSAHEAQYRTPRVRKHKYVPRAHYGGRHMVTMLPGSGIGPELMNYVIDIFQFIGAPVDFEVVNVNPRADNDEDVEYAITTIQRNGTCIKGNIETSLELASVSSRNVALRNELDIYAYLIHCKSYPGITTRHGAIDIVVVRQNTEGEYAMLEHESVTGVVESMKVMTASNAERLAYFAFEFAKKAGRNKVTTIHKADVLKLSDGLFLNKCREVAKEYPEIKHSDMNVDYCCLQLVSKPQQFDVMLMPNLYGTIVGNVICGMVGGAGLLSGRNYGDYYAVFEPGTRNTGTGIAGKNVANPVAMINAGVDLLDHLGHHYHAELIGNAVMKTINIDRILTPDVGGKASSADVVKAIKDNIKFFVKLEPK